MKKTFLALSLFVSLFAFSTQSSFAAENQNFFQRIQSSITNTTQRLYLMIPGDKPGALVLNQATQAFPSLQSEEVSTDISLDIQKEGQSLGNIKFHTNGPFKMNQKMAQQDQHLTGSFSMQGTTMQADANLKMTDKKMYVKLNEVPVLPYINLVDLKGRWLVLDLSKTTQTPSTWTDAQKQEFQDANMTLVKNSEVSSAQKATKDDHAVYVVTIKVPKTTLIEYVDVLQKISAENKDDAETTSDVKTSAHESLQKLLENTSDIELTLWIDRGNFYVRHVEVPVVYTKPAGAEETAMNENNPFSNLSQFQTVKLLVVVNFDQFNVPTTFEEPTDAEDAQQVLQKLMGGTAASGSATGTMGTKMPVVPSMVNPSELPSLTPQQRVQLEKYQKMQLQQVPQVPGQ